RGCPCEPPRALTPPAVLAGLDQIQLGKRVVAVLLQPQVAGPRVEVEAEAVAPPVGEHLVDVGGDLRVLLDLAADLAARQPAGGGGDVRAAGRAVGCGS